MSKKRSGGQWAVRVLLALVLVAAGLLAGALIRGKNGATRSAGTVATTTTSPKPTSTSSPDPAPSNGADLRIMSVGCLALQTLAGALAQAEANGTVTALQALPTGPASAWSNVNEVGEVNSMPAYQQIASDAGDLIQDIGQAETDGDPSTADFALTQMESDCSNFDLPTAS